MIAWLEGMVRDLLGQLGNLSRQLVAATGSQAQKIDELQGVSRRIWLSLRGAMIGSSVAVLG